LSVKWSEKKRVTQKFNVEKLKEYTNLQNYIETIHKNLIFISHKKRIGTQPTSRSRRKVGISSGAKRIQAGRPSNLILKHLVGRKKYVWV